MSFLVDSSNTTDRTECPSRYMTSDYHRSLGLAIYHPEPEVNKLIENLEFTTTELPLSLRLDIFWTPSARSKQCSDVIWTAQSRTLSSHRSPGTPSRQDQLSSSATSLPWIDRDVHFSHDIILKWKWLLQLAPETEECQHKSIRRAQTANAAHIMLSPVIS